MGRAALFARALWWRRGLGAAVLVVGVIVTAVAALGPLYARAAAESTLSDRLASTAAADAGLGFTTRADVTSPSAIAEVAAQLPAPGSIRGYPSRVPGLTVPVTAGIGKSLPSLTSLVWREGACAHLIVISGRCPSGPHEAIVDDNALQARPNWALGQTLDITYGTGLDPGELLDAIKIVGSYRPASTTDPFWFGRSYFSAHLSPVASPNQVTALFVTEAEFAVLPPGTDGQVAIDYPIDPGQVRLDTIDSLQRQVAALQTSFAADASKPALRTQLPAVLDRSRADHRQVDIDTLLVIVELAILSWLALFGIVADAIGARGNDIALAKLRGQRPTSVLWFAVGEPLALLALALPLGLLAAVGITHVLGAGVLVPGTPIVLTPAVGVAVAVAFAGSAVAALLAARTILTRPVLEQWRSASSRVGQGRGARWSIAFDLLLVVAAIAGLVALRRSGEHPRSITLLAPGLLLFAIALVGVRLIPPVIRARLRSGRGSRRTGLFLAVRQLARRPAGLRLAALLAVSVGLASFAIASESVAAANRDARARTELGASQVASVQFQPTHDPQAVAEQLDPEGRWAMATATWIPDGAVASAGEAAVTGRLLAVDAARLPTIGSDVRGHLSMTEIADTILEPSAVPAPFQGTQLRVRIDAESIEGEAPFVGVRIRRAHEQTTSVRTTVLRPGVHDYTATVDCAAGCAFAGLTWERPFDDIADEHDVVRITALESSNGASWKKLGADLSTAALWRGDSLGGNAATQVEADASGLHVSVRSGGGTSAILVYGEAPGRVPLVASPGGISGPGDTGAMLDFTNAQSDFVIARRAAVLPQVLDAGAIANLDYLRIQLPDFDYEATWSIWLGPNAPADAVSRLRGAGLIVEQVRTEHHRVIVLGRQGPALALILLLICAVAAAVLAVGGTTINIVASGRRRAFELAALRVVGVPSKSLRRACVLEQLLLLGASLLVGLPAGYVVARLVMPAIPEFSDATPVVLRYTPQLLPIVVFAAAFAVLVTLTAITAGVALARAAVPARLREVQQ